MNKLEYRFRIHDLEEEKAILDSHMLRGRKIGVMGLDYDVTYDEFLDWLDNLTERHDYMIRVYFNKITSLRKFKKKVKRLLKDIVCGNFHCSEYENENPICPYAKHETKDSVCEYLWRCVLHDETMFSHDEDF